MKRYATGLSTDKFSFRLSRSREDIVFHRQSIFYRDKWHSISRCRIARVLRHQFSRYSRHPTASGETCERRGGRDGVGSLNILQCSSTRPIRRRFSFAETAELGGRTRMKRGGERKTDDEKRRNERTLGSCRLNGTELKSFAWRQARHVVVVVAGFSTWQSSRRQHACLLFPVRSYN